MLAWRQHESLRIGGWMFRTCGLHTENTHFYRTAFSYTERERTWSLVIADDVQNGLCKI